MLLLPLAWLWAARLVPSSYSVMTMGPADHGGVLASHGHRPGAAAGRDVTTLVEPDRGPAEVRVTLTARRQQVTVPGGPTLTAYTLNGTTPGPTIRAQEGDLDVGVTLVRADQGRDVAPAGGPGEVVVGERGPATEVDGAHRHHRVGRRHQARRPQPGQRQEHHEGSGERDDQADARSPTAPSCGRLRRQRAARTRCQ